MKHYKWKCLLCKMTGTVETNTLDVWYLMHLIEGAHERANPNCDSVLGLFPADGDYLKGQY